MEELVEFIVEEIPEFFVWLFEYIKDKYDELKAML